MYVYVYIYIYIYIVYIYIYMSVIVGGQKEKGICAVARGPICTFCICVIIMLL